MTLSSVERLEAPAQSLQPLPRSTSTLTMFCDTDRAAQARRINLNCPTFESSVYVLHDVYIKFRERSGNALCAMRNQAQLRPRPSIRMSAHNKIHKKSHTANREIFAVKIFRRRPLPRKIKHAKYCMHSKYVYRPIIIIIIIIISMNTPLKVYRVS